MRANIARGPARARSCRVCAPIGLLLACGFNWFGQPVLDIFHIHQANIAQGACRDHLARLADHRIAGVIVRQRKDHAAGLCRLGQFLGLGQGGCQRLVADHMDAAL